MKSTFAEILSMLRREKSLSQRRVASDLGISQALLSHYENGAREPKLEFVIKVCDYYSVTADYILGRSDKREAETLRIIRMVSDIADALEEIKSAEAGLIDELKLLVTKDKE